MEDSKSKSSVPGNAATISCQPCGLENKDKEASGYCQDCAEYLCKECYSIHKKTKPTRNHILLDGSKMPTDQSCLEHPGNVIEYVCKLHQDLVCNVCKLSSHSPCELYLEPINDVEKMSTPEYKILLARIDELRDNFYQNIHPAAEKAIQEIKNNRETIHYQVKEFRKNINIQLDKWEKALYDENDRKHDEIMKVVNSADTKSEEIIKDAEQLKQKLEKILKTGNYKSHYIQAKRGEMSLNENILRQQETESDQYLPVFARNREEFEKWSSQNVIGKLCESEQQVFPFKMTSTVPMKQLFGGSALGMQQVPSIPTVPGSMHPGQLKPTGNYSVQAGQPMPTSNYSMQLGQPMPTGTYSMQWGQPMPTGNYSVQPGQPMPTGNYSVQPRQPMPTGTYSMQWGQPMSTGNYSMQWGQHMPTGNYSMQLGQPMSTGNYCMQLGQPMSTGNYSMQPGLFMQQPYPYNMQWQPMQQSGFYNSM